MTTCKLTMSGNFKSLTSWKSRVELHEITELLKIEFIVWFSLQKKKGYSQEKIYKFDERLTHYYCVSTWIWVSVHTMCCSHDPVRPYQGSSTNMSTPYTERNLPWPGVGAGILSINYSGEGRTHTTSCQSSKMQRLVFFFCSSFTCTFTFMLTDPDVIKKSGRGVRIRKSDISLLSSETHSCLPISANISMNFLHIFFGAKHLPCWRF